MGIRTETAAKLSRPAGTPEAFTVHNPIVTTATGRSGPPAISSRIHTLNRPNMVSVGVIVWLASELMFFAGLFGIYFTAKATNTTGEWPTHPTELDVPYALTF